jgi:hypothetical protein
MGEVYHDASSEQSLVMWWFRICCTDALQFGCLHGARDAPEVCLKFFEQSVLLDNHVVEFVVEALDVRKVRFDAFKPSLNIAGFHSM